MLDSAGGEQVGLAENQETEEFPFSAGLRRIKGLAGRRDTAHTCGKQGNIFNGVVIILKGE